MTSSRFIAALVALVSLPVLMSGCTVNPATGQQAFTGGMSTSQEIALGRQQHPKIVKHFGGAYGSPTLRRYVDSIGQLLVRTVERRDLKYTFTIVVSPIVNAFAVPGGYVYVSRGLLALADNEAQLAGVMAHELGHLTALHHARRHGQGVLANILIAGVSIVGGNGIAQAGQVGAAALLRGFSREHELEADQLGIRYMARAGYDPQELTKFLGKLRAQSRLVAVLQGKSPDKVDQFNYLATHPAPAERVRRASATAAATKVPRPMRAQAAYFGKIRGMLFGDDPKQGFIRGRVFSHPTLRFTFTVPEGFRLFNSSRSVIAAGPKGARMLFNLAPKPPPGRMTDYLQSVWTKSLRLSQVEQININGMEAATGAARVRTKSGDFDLRLVAIRRSQREIYRFMFLTPPALTGSLSVAMRRTSYSFRTLSARKAKALKPLRLRIVEVRRGDTVARMAKRMAFADYKVERFRVLNGLAPGQSLRAGQPVKIVTQ